ncbi:unnamed protein product [Lymnaea stagnalis]|uniref:Uncharacterized protein n=1 Tax=Lymnaea stagnalis TaxID=6523 RepID=A0AAV2I774_LYMST
MNTSLRNEINYVQSVASRFRFRDISCARIFDGDENYTEEALALAPTFNTSLDDQNYLDLTEDCDVFRYTRGYLMSSLTEEEKNFPIAFSLVVYTDTEMVERLLRAIYRPQNYYCIHVDLKASESYFGAIKAISECFSNVFLSAKRVDVQWGTFTVLEPELICMKELWRYRKWKYFINLTGQEFPLKTNFELVKILKSYDGANNIEGTIKNANKERWKDPPPDGLRPVKGSVHITASRWVG